MLNLLKKPQHGIILYLAKLARLSSNKMGQIVENVSSSKLAKSSSGLKKRGKGMKSGGSSLDLADPKVQSVLLVGLLAVLALALWFGFSNGCFSRRRRRRRSC